MTPNTPKAPPKATEPPETWLSVSAAAAALGVSERTARRFCKTGKIEAQRVALEGTGGRAWRVKADTLKSERPANGQSSKNGRTSERSSFYVANGQSDSVRPNGQALAARPNAPPNATVCEVEVLRDALAREREINRQFGAIIEQLQRDGAEVRAALREALKLAPKELLAPDSENATEFRKVPKSPISFDSLEASKRPQNGAQATKTAISYGDVADWLEKEVTL